MNWFKSYLAFALTLSTVAAMAGTNELDIAQEALRDELWDVARRHAGRVPGDSGRMIVLESFAREENWKGLSDAIDAMGYPSGEGYTYYRALGLFQRGEVASASNLLASVSAWPAAYRRPAARLKASMAVSAGKLPEALAILESEGGDDVETMLMTASLLRQDGKGESAMGLWRSIAARTNASESALAQAAAGIGDASTLERISTSARSVRVRCFAMLNLGVMRLRDDKTFDSGERLIRQVAHDHPDSAGAYTAFLALADALIGRKSWAKAEQTYSDALSIWPEASKDAALHEGRGDALGRLGRTAEAIQEFRRAEELFADSERKAMAAVKAADVLSLTGDVEASTAAYRNVQSNYSDTAVAARAAHVVSLREMEGRGRAIYREFKFDQARKIFEDLAHEDPARRERMTFYCALCVYGAGNDAAAETSVRTLVAGAKDAAVRAEATLWLAKLTFNRQEWLEAKKLFDAYVALCPKSPQAPQVLVWSAQSALACNDFKGVIATVARIVSAYPDSPLRAAGLLAQGEALIELARFDEAVLVLERAATIPGISGDDRLRARILLADALFAMGADNPARYRAALEAYNAIRTGESLTPSAELSLAFKVARTLEKLNRKDEAIDMYYTQVVLAYRTGRIAGTSFDEDSRATFARAAFRLVEEYENAGRLRQAVHVLDLVRTSDVQAAGEAASRIERITRKGLLP